MSNRKNEDLKLDVISKIDPEIIDEVTNKRIKYINAMGKGNKKKLTAIIAIAAAVAVLLSVMAVIIIPLLKPSGSVPIYTGMTVSAPGGESLSIGVKPLSANGLFVPGINVLDNSNTAGNNGNHGSNNPNKKPVEDIINDSGTLATIPSEQMYYAKQNEDIIITIHFENPDNYKIMSFMLNGVPYADYMFEYGSDYENIMIKVNVGEALGIVDYTIDAIQYADRDVLKYVEMKGDPTLSIGVYNENVPVPAITNEKIGTNSVSFDIDLPGANSLAALSGKLYAIVANDTEIVKQQKLDPGQTSVKFEGLKTGTAYRYAIIAEYDALDGNGYKSYILTEKEFTTEAIIMIENVTPTENSVSFSLKWNDIFTGTKALTSLELYQGENKIKDVDFNASEISDLISDTEYTLVAKYDNNGAPETAEFTLKTAARTVTYTVNHYIQNLENEDYTLKETDNLTAPENTDLTPATKLYSGFASPAKQTVKVLPDGSLVVDYYYTRNTYTINFVSNGGAAIPAQTLKYDADIPTLPDATRESDTFGGWFTDAKLTTTFTLQKMGAANVTLYAYWEGETKPGSFSLNSGNILKFIGSETEVVIPQYIAGKAITRIGSGAFARCEGVTSVAIPNCVTHIGIEAFFGCIGLESVTIGSGITNIGFHAFGDCTGLNAVHINSIETWCKIVFELSGSGSYTNADGSFLSNPLWYANNLYLNGELLTDLVIPNGITSINSPTFINCLSIKSITIPSSVKTIGETAFQGCIGLTSINISEGLTSIGYGAFFACSNLTSIVIPDSVIDIGGSAFEKCTELTSVTFGNGIKKIDSRTFALCNNLNSITIPDSVTSIGYGAFWDCESLSSVIIGNGVTDINGMAFCNCVGLTSLIIGNSVKTIGENAFYNCQELKTLTIPDTVTTIEESAFAYCYKLTDITIGKGIKKIHESVFENCYVLTVINFNGTVSEWNKIIKYSNWNKNTGTYVIHCTDGDLTKEES